MGGGCRQRKFKREVLAGGNSRPDGHAVRHVGMWLLSEDQVGRGGRRLSKWWDVYHKCILERLLWQQWVEGLGGRQAAPGAEAPPGGAEDT